MKIGFSTQMTTDYIPSVTKASVPQVNQKQLTNDLFEKKSSVSFKGKDYSEKDVRYARQYMNRKDDKWKQELYEKEYKYKKENEPIWFTYHPRYGAGSATINLNDPTERLITGICSLGMSEITVQSAYADFRKDAKRYVDKIDLVKADLINAKVNETGAENRKVQDAARRDVTFIEEMNNVKEKEIYPKLLDKIQAKREGKNVEIPNCVMFSNKDNSINQELISWTINQANADSKEVDLFDENLDFVELLEKSEKNYKKTGNWNVINVKNLDKTINPKQSDSAVIAGMKDIMSSTANDYNSTLIFSTTNPDELDDTAIESNRVTKIETKNVKTKDEMEIQDIKNRLADKDYVKNSPIAAINDLLILTDKNTAKQFELNFNSTRSNLDKTRTKIETSLSGNNTLSKQYKPILDNACSNLWYIV